MEIIKKIKPVHYYLMGGLLAGIGSTFESTAAIHYVLFSLGLFLTIFGIVKYFRDK